MVNAVSANTKALPDKKVEEKKEEAKPKAQTPSPAPSPPPAADKNADHGPNTPTGGLPPRPPLKLLKD